MTNAGILEAIKRLLTAKIPFAFMTNNEDTEAAKAARISGLLGLTLGAERVVTSLTPYRGLVQKYGNARVLVIGRPEAVRIAREYGFTNHVGLPEYVDSHRQLVPHLTHKFESDSAGPRDNQKIKAILVFSEPDDWHTALQVMVDVLSSDGEPCEELGGHASSTQVVDLFFSNLDFTYPASHSGKCSN